MKQRKLGKIMLCLAIAVVMCLGMATTALAEDAKGTAGTPTAPAKAAITKSLELADGVATPAVTFTFKFVKIDVDGTAINVATPDTDNKLMPALPDRTVEFKTTDTQTADANGLVKLNKETVNIFDGVTFPHAGVYTYLVYEQQTSTFTDTTTQTMTYASNQYRISVYVANDTRTGHEGEVYVKNIGAVIDTSTTPGTPGTPGTAGTDKLDPTPGTPGTPGELVVDIDGLSDLIFTNVYNEKSNPVKPDPDSNMLTVSKTVAGDYGDKTKYFDFSITLTKPATVTETVAYKGYVLDANDNVVTGNDNVDAANTAWIKTDAFGAYIEFPVAANATATPKLPASVTRTIKLKDGQKIVFNNSQIGGKFQSVETAATDYTASVVVKANNATVTPTGATVDSGKQIIGATPVNHADYTNTYKNITPTGIIMNNLPYIMLIVVALGALAAFIAVKSRKRKAADNRH